MLQHSRLVEMFHFVFLLCFHLILHMVASLEISRCYLADYVIEIRHTCSSIILLFWYYRSYRCRCLNSLLSFRQAGVKKSSLLSCNLSVHSAMHLNLSLAKTWSFIDWLNVQLALSQRAYVGHNLRAFFPLVMLIFLLFMCSSTGWQIRSNEVDGDCR